MILAVALVAICLSVNTTEEIVKVAAASIAVLCLFLSLLFSPILVKLLLVVALLASQKWTASRLGKYISPSAK
jgi:hypothetical protein